MSLTIRFLYRELSYSTTEYLRTDSIERLTWKRQCRHIDAGDGRVPLLSSPTYRLFVFPIDRDPWATASARQRLIAASRDNTETSKIQHGKKYLYNTSNSIDVNETSNCLFTTNMKNSRNVVFERMSIY